MQRAILFYYSFNLNEVIVSIVRISFYWLNFNYSIAEVLKQIYYCQAKNQSTVSNLVFDIKMKCIDNNFLYKQQLYYLLGETPCKCFTCQSVPSSVYGLALPPPFDTTFHHHQKGPHTLVVEKCDCLKHCSFKKNSVNIYKTSVLGAGSRIRL